MCTKHGFRFADDAEELGNARQVSVKLSIIDPSSESNPIDHRRSHTAIVRRMSHKPVVLRPVRFFSGAKYACIPIKFSSQTSPKPELEEIDSVFIFAGLTST